MRWASFVSFGWHLFRSLCASVASFCFYNFSFLQLHTWVLGCYYSLFPSHATIFTLSTRANSCISRNSTSFNISVQTLSQNRYVFNLAALNCTRALTFVLSAVLIDLSNCSNTFKASCGVIWPNCCCCCCCRWLHQTGEKKNKKSKHIET